MTRNEKLFQFFSQEHDQTLLDGQINDIVLAVERSAWKDPKEELPVDGETVTVYDPENFIETKQIRRIRYCESVNKFFKKQYPRWRYPLQKPKI